MFIWRIGGKQEVVQKRVRGDESATDFRRTLHFLEPDSGSLESRITTISKPYRSQACRQVPQSGTSHVGCRKHATKFRESRFELFC